MNITINTKPGGTAQLLKAVDYIFPSRARTDGRLYDKVQNAKADLLIEMMKSFASKQMDLGKNPEEILNIIERNFYKIEGQQKNVNDTLLITQKELENDNSSNSTDVEKDFVLAWADKVGNISNKDMQELWAKILAGEIRQPGSFSKRALESLFSMTPKDASSFEKIVSMSSWDDVHKDALVVLIFTPDLDPYSISFMELLSLEDMGLISHVSDGLQYGIGTLPITSHNKSYSLKVDLTQSENKGKIMYQCLRLTGIGCELAKLTVIKDNLKYFRDLEQNLIKQKYKITFQQN